MASPRKSSGPPSGRPPTVKFARRTSSGRVVSLSRDDEIDFSGEFAVGSGSGDFINYTVLMPPTPDNQPMAGDGPSAAAAAPSAAATTGVTRGSKPPPPLKGAGAVAGSKRPMQMMPTQSSLMRTQTGDFDQNRWLYESTGTYGYGNAFWTQGAAGEVGATAGGAYHGMETMAEVSISDFMEQPWRPLTRKVPIAAAIISPYRLLVAVRLVFLGLFLSWRVRNPNKDAVWLWGMSVVCEVWFAFSWVMDQLPKLNPINRAADLAALRDKFEQPSPSNPTARSDLPGIDIFVSTADPEKEPPLVTANTVLSILAAEYPVEKLSCYISDDGGALLTFEALAETAIFAEVWVPFCRKHAIEPRSPESYFAAKGDPTKNKKSPDFIKDRRWIKREYDEFKVRINALPGSLRRRSKSNNARELKAARDAATGVGTAASPDELRIPSATWMADGTHWPGTWLDPAPDHRRGDHAGIIQVMVKVPASEPVYGGPNESTLDFTGVDIRLPMFAYVSREKRPGYDHNKKAGAMNALVRASAILSNGPFILNLDCDHYIYNSLAMKEGMCYLMDRGGDRICYVQFPQRFEGIDPSDRYANHNTVFFDGNMRALDGLQGPVYVGTGCLFRRFALYGFHPPRAREYSGFFGRHKTTAPRIPDTASDEETRPLTGGHPDLNLPHKFGSSTAFTDSIPVAEFQGRPLADHHSIKNGRPPGALLIQRGPLDAPTVAEAVSVISCWYEDKTEWGDRIGWIYGSVTEDVVTGYRMHNRGWRSVYCITERDAFRGTAPINLTDRLHQVLRWATGSVEIFFSRNNALFGSRRLKFLQRIAYMNVGIYPFTSFFLVTYCFLPALSLFSGQFIVQTLSATFLTYLLLMSLCLTLISLLEVKWSGIALEEWWRNEQFWVIGGTSAHLVAVLQGLLKAIAGIEISFTLTSKAGGGEEEEDVYADLYLIKWSGLMIPPLTIIVVNMVALVIGVARTVYSVIPQWSKLIGGGFFSFWVLAHMYPFCKGLMGRRGRAPTIIWVWTGLLSITISLLWVALNPSDQLNAAGEISL